MRSKLRSAWSLGIGMVIMLAVPAFAVEISWVPIRDLGNGADTTGYGTVNRAYWISEFEITNEQYSEFLNAVSTTDAYGLYHTNMANPLPPGHGGITRSGSAGSYTYAPIAGREDMPVNWVSYYDALRFANWLHNGQPAGPQDWTTTEAGAYLFSGTSRAGARGPQARVFLTNEDEWYKAAYHAPLTASYDLYPTHSSTTPTCGTIGAPNFANCGSAVGDFVAVRSYVYSDSAWNAHDLGGNAAEWVDAWIGGDVVVLGGSFADPATELASTSRPSAPRSVGYFDVGFRVAAAPAHVDMEWVTVADPDNSCIVQPEGCFGYARFIYRIGTYEVTNSQYVAFLNAVAWADPNGLYDTSMDGITRQTSLGLGEYYYRTNAGDENKPVVEVSFWDAVRFANWLHNGQPANGVQDSTTTEDGAYTLDPIAMANNTVFRKHDAEIFLPGEDEWYKAAYYDPVSSDYFAFPAGSNTQITCGLPSAIPNRANCDSVVPGSTAVGGYTGSPSPNGTFDQGGNVQELTDTKIGAVRITRGGAFNDVAFFLSSEECRGGTLPTSQDGTVGFRVAATQGPPIALDDQAQSSVVGHARDGFGSEAKDLANVVSLPFVHSTSAISGANSALTDFDFSADSFSFSFDDERTGNGDAPLAASYATIAFSVLDPVSYDASGDYFTFTSDYSTPYTGHYVVLSVKLYDVTDSIFMFKSVQQSGQTQFESFTLGGSGGDLSNEFEGSLTGALTPGHDYRLYLTTGIAGGSVPALTAYSEASGSVSIVFVPEPGANLLLIAGAACLAALRYRASRAVRASRPLSRAA